MQSTKSYSEAVFFCMIVCGFSVLSTQQQAAAVPPDRAMAQSLTDGDIHSGWHSRYFSEGRDSLDGDSLWVSSIDLAWNKYSGQVWYGTSPQRDFDELQLFIAFGHNVRDVEFYVGYKRLEFPADKFHDTELSAGISWPGLPAGAELTIDTTYSVEANGWFYDLGVQRRFVVSDALSVQAIGNLGVNQGFVSDGHKGSNHFMLQAGAEYLLTKAIAVTTYAAYTWAVNQNESLAGDAQLNDFFYGGIGVRWHFR